MRDETFGFDEARKRLEEGKAISRRSDPVKVWKVVDGLLRYSFRYGSVWFASGGFPLSWPDSDDFYEVDNE